MIDARIPLGIRQPDTANALLRGTQAAGTANSVIRDNRLAQTYAQHGAGILSGDMNALNALAGVDPRGALQARQAHQQMQHAEERLRLARAAGARAAANVKSREEAQRLATEAAESNRIVAMAMADPENADRYFANSPLTQEYIGQDPAVVYAGIQGFQGNLQDVWAMSQPEESSEPAAIQGLRIRAQESGLQAGTPEYQEFMRTGGRVEQSETIYGPDGNVIYERGATRPDAPKMTVEAGKNAGYYNRMLDANETLDGLEGQGTSFIQQNLENAPLGVGNYFRSPDFQQFDQARRDFVNAVLRRESGAVISESEFDNANKQYFPQPGDSPEVIEQKRRNRQTALEGVRMGAGEGASYVDQNRAASNTPPDFLSQQDTANWEYYTEEERRAILASPEYQQ